MTRAIPEKELAALFDLGYHLKHVDTIFERVFGLAGDPGSPTRRQATPASLTPLRPCESAAPESADCSP